ncbi:ABC-type amino acid transport substrate-binding protein [Stella humosa]|uniref:ABC-type amino acid transport substrate-binding protein n=1 Tax=Stella humosa TaxID=94 RepID=A0A3N1M806_9PROT|nr:transporter substrate-binding domain-containing protein [Stella humosa]ROQ01962.1 ABC-type amino acid transport substrate-binding protein [Stella humosa]BBK32351.1 amino acid ABC transporter substrate-binding protein [Stella humosa]
MSDQIDSSRRGLLTGVAMAGAAAGAAGILAGATSIREAHAQMLDTGISENSVLSKIRKAGVLRAGYAQTGPWFYKDAKTGELGGIYKDCVEKLAAEMQIKVEWSEVTFANATVGLRKGDFDLFGSSAVYTMARAMTVQFIGPLYSKGTLCLAHKDNAGRFKTAADFNDPSVTISVTAGASEEGRIATLFPKAKVITTTGQVTLGAEPVRAKRADLWISGDSDVILFAKRNASWAYVVDPENPLDRRPNTWMVRYGDPEWKAFLDFYGTFLSVNGEVQRLFDHHMAKLT